MDALQLLIIFTGIVSSISIICYTIAYIMTHPNIIKAIKEIFQNAQGN